ncbi:MAG: hypothetical protein COV44_03960 [Deltaproteobacteria bacterium CG11_big_fil_rev_8_21_14_0_20_45_16]|nr:MAG: hypothetical protein COV44_03960 [Deltaproteobacteria bacterium CG11_big_fil_rev_8_21_14_0_20_45_16]
MSQPMDNQILTTMRKSTESKKRIALVNDDPAMMQYYSHFLEQNGYEAMIFFDGTRQPDGTGVFRHWGRVRPKS